MKTNKISALLFSIALLGSVSIVEAALIGPAWPAPGGTSFSASGAAGATGGQDRTYSAFDFSAFDQLWWGLGSVRSSMDGEIDSAGETMSLVSMAGSVAVWNGVTSINGSSVDTLLTVTIGTGAPGGWLDPSTFGVSLTETNAFAEITSDPFTVNLTLEARFTDDTTYVSFLGLFDANSDFSQDGDAIFSNFGNIYSTSVVPVPAAAWLFGSGLLGLVGVARRKIA